MAFNLWLAFLFSAFIIAVSPGSGAILIVSHGLQYGIKKTTITILGLQAGSAIICFIVGLGLSSFFTSQTTLNYIKLFGALYLFYLGVQQWRHPLIIYNSNQPLAHTNIPHWHQRFLNGLLTNLINPKSIIFIAAVFPQFISTTYPFWPQIGIMTFTLCAIDFIVMHGYAGMAAALQTFFTNPKWVKIKNRFLGSILIFAGLLLFLFRP
jgi:homoserine/homoserine lactone efflux protein